MFADSSLFRHINSDAHKIRAPILEAPALTWHLAFLLRNQVSDDFETNRTTLKQQLDSTILRLVAGLRGELGADAVRIMPCVKDAFILFDGIYSGEPLRKMPPECCTKRQISVLEADQRLVNLRFRWNGSNLIVRTQIFSEYFTITVFAEVPKELVSGEDPKERIDKLGYAIADFDKLTLQYWEEYTRFVVSLPGLENLFHSEIFQHVFADGRGVIVADECIPFVNAKFVTKEEKPDWATLVTGNLRAIVTQADRYECSASYMLDGRALFLTALGPQRPDFPDEQRMPLTFLLCVQQNREDRSGYIVNPSQLGRLIDRLLLSGTVRLAALLDLRLLRVASRRLSQIDPLIDEARRAVEEYGHERERTDQTRHLVDIARNRLNAIASDFLNSEENISGTGLSYRVETSRYYVTQYQANLPALRIGRVEGYQKYDQFIERRLGSTFDFIDRLGVRYERALSAVAGTDQSFSTIQSTHINLSIEKIQKYSDIILVNFLLPYYIVGSLLHVEDVNNVFFGAILILIISLLMAVGAWRAIKLERRSEAATFVMRTLVVVFILLVWAISFFLYGHSHHLQDNI